MLPDALYARQSTLFSRVDSLQRIERELIAAAAGTGRGRPQDWDDLERRHRELEASKARVHQLIVAIDDNVEVIQNSLVQLELAPAPDVASDDLEQWQIRRRIGVRSQFDELFDEAAKFERAP
jgi:hypothetical protein